MKPPADAEIAHKSARDVQSLDDAIVAYVRARDWENDVRVAWLRAIKSVDEADRAREERRRAVERLAEARAHVLRVQSQPRMKGAGAARAWHEASGALREATVWHAASQLIVSELERAERRYVYEFERTRDDNPFVAALWRECVRRGADNDTVTNCRQSSAS